MVSLQENRLVFLASVDQEVDGLAGFRAAIDVVAEKNVDCPPWPDGREVFVDHGEHFLKQISAAVNIADRVDAESVW